MIDNFIMLTKQGGILKPFANILGFILDMIFRALEAIGIHNLGISIIFFTIVIYVLMLPLTYKQQKFSKFSAKMNPEVQAIQAKYKDRKDQDSMMRMQQETQLIYEKYGVSPSGSCLQLLIQMPILFALYRVIYNMPAYIKKLGDIFNVLAHKVVTTDHGFFLANSDSTNIATTIKSYGKAFTTAAEAVSSNGINYIGTISDNAVSSPQFTQLCNGVTDVLNRLSTADLSAVADHYNLGELTFQGQQILSTYSDAACTKVASAGLIDQFNTFLGVNISNSPSYILNNEWGLGSGKNWWIIILAVLIPLLAALTQWVNTLLIPQPAQNNGDQNQMASSLKVMNKIMPIMSAFMCFILPVGMGIYWIIGAVVRGVIQVVLNKKIDKIDIEAMIAENIEKANIKRAKKGLPSYEAAASAVKANNNKKYSGSSSSSVNSFKSGNANKYKNNVDRDTGIKDSTEYYNNLNGAKKGSLASKVMMVKQFNEKGSSKGSDKKDE